MPPLKYKYIGSDRHLSYDSIRRLVLHRLSNPDRKKAWKHLDKCYRCRSIHESLARPSKVRRNRSRSSIGLKLLVSILVISGLIGLSLSLGHFGSITTMCVEDAYQLYSWSLMKIKNHELSPLSPQPPEVEPGEHLKKGARDHPVRFMDQYLVTTSDYKKPVVSHLGADQEHHQVKFHEIHGQITTHDEPLQGVTIMIPDSKTAKISNADGKYAIQVPGNTTSLLFIYQGKQLAKAIDTTSGRLDINLIVEHMKYPEVESPENDKELVADN